MRFLETAPRFPDWTGLRKGRGNNGYCILSLRADSTAGLRYVDWMGNLRCEAELARTGAGGVMELAGVEEHPMPGRLSGESNH